MQKEGIVLNWDKYLKLENQLCFAVYACSREFTKLYRPYLDELGITYPQFLVLTVLWEQPQLTVKEIGEQLYLDSGTLTPMLKRMEAIDLVMRTRDTKDERQVIIQLTEKGQQLREEAKMLPEACIPQFQLSEQQYETLLTGMNELIHHLQHASKNRD